jgi:hypothetical protein
MRFGIALTAIGLLVSLPLAAQDTPQRAEPLPPPALADPGGNAPGGNEPVTLEQAMPGAGEKVLPRDRTPEEIAAAERIEPALPEKVRPPEELAPGVTIRTEGDVTIEEYRRDGNVYMVVVHPKSGVSYTYMDTDGDGRLEGDPREGPVQPVYYTLYSWE